MAETHKEVVKVWIAPGCIVCDACETDCPEVFDVQEETCIIRPEAKSADFTKPLTPSIFTAAEGCPVEVIKFETIDVEGPEPWAGKEAAAADAQTVGAGASGASGGAKKGGGTVIPEGPPDPKWAKVIGRAHVSGSRSAGGPAVAMMQSAKAPPEAISMSLPKGSPPDALDSVMVGTGYARPKLSIGDRIRAKASGIASAASMTRRDFNGVVAAAWAMLAFVGATAGAAFQSFLVPKVTKEPPSTFRVGKLSDYPEPGVYETYKPQNVWIVYLPEGQIVAVSTICTHLGCIPNWLQGDKKFKCPCHGSGFYMNGVNFEGPAPRPLERYKIQLEGEWIVVDKSMIYRQELGQWTAPGAALTV